MKEGKVSGLSWNDLTKNPKKITVKLMWEIFARQVYPTVSERSEQWVHMRRCFYCGFIECQKFYTDMSCDLPEDQAVEVLSRVTKECNEFFDKDLAPLLPKRDPSKLMG